MRALGFCPRAPKTVGEHKIRAKVGIRGAEAGGFCRKFRAGAALTLVGESRDVNPLSPTHAER